MGLTMPYLLDLVRLVRAALCWGAACAIGKPPGGRCDGRLGDVSAQSDCEWRTCRRNIGAMARVTFRVIAGKDGDRCAKRSAVRRKSPADSGAETRVSMKRERNYTQSRHPSVR